MDDDKYCRGTKNMEGCGEKFPLDNFYVNIKTGQIKNLCKNCVNKHNKNKRNSNNTKTLKYNDENKMLKEQISSFKYKEDFYMNLINKLTNANEELIFINKNLSEKILVYNEISTKIDELSAASFENLYVFG